MSHPLTGEVSDLRQRLDQLRSMQREAMRPDGLTRLMRCVARIVDGQAALLAEDGRLVCAVPEMGRDVLDAFADGIERVRSGRSRSAAVDHGRLLVSAVSVGDGTPSAVLVVVAEKEVQHRTTALIADATRLMWLCWNVERARDTRHRVDQADVQTREVVLHLLMLGECGGAHRVAAALGPCLPDPLRVYVAESRTQKRDVLAAEFSEASGDTAWVVRCPVYTGHVIVLAPSAAGTEPESGTDDPIEDRFCHLVAERDGILLGASQAVSLRDTPVGYEQAFHALAAARESADRHATFNPRADLAALLMPAGRGWASELLRPLLEHVPDRPQDPDAGDLKTTLGSWLNFHSRAPRQLKIHRNTLSARLVHLERILGVDLRDVVVQAQLHLALRLLDYPDTEPSGDTGVSVEALFAGGSVRQWAQRQLSPLLGEHTQLLLTTLRTWLAHNARLDTTAAKLEISEAGARKRLLRIEGLLERSLLHGPSARYDLYFALRAYDGQGLPSQDRPS